MTLFANGISMFKKYNKLSNQKKFVIVIRKIVTSLMSKVFAMVLFLLFYILILHPMIVEDREFNPPFFDLLNLFIFNPAGHFSIYIFFGIFFIMSNLFTKVLVTETKLVNSFKINKFIINSFKKYR